MTDLEIRQLHGLGIRGFSYPVRGVIFGVCHAWKLYAQWIIFGRIGTVGSESNIASGSAAATIPQTLSKRGFQSSSNDTYKMMMYSTAE